MKIRGIYTYNTYFTRKDTGRNLKDNNKTKIKQQPKFGAVSGKFWGGLFGASAAGIGTLVALAAGPVGWLAELTYITACVGGGVVGSKIGDKVTGEDKE